MDSQTRNKYRIEMVRIRNVIRETPEIKTYVLDEHARFRPGQFALVSLLGIGECPISYSSWPDTEMTVDEVGGVTRAMDKLKPGQKVGIRGPYGNGYPTDYLKGRDVYLISGGCGLAPMRSLIRYYETHMDEVKSLNIFFGARTPEMIPFKHDISSWKRRFNVFISVDKPDRKWKGHTGFVTDLLASQEFPMKPVAVFCGPPVMFRYTARILKDKGFNEQDMIVSLERNMQCGVGECLHCNIGGKLVCRDGPVFRWSEIKNSEMMRE